MTKGAVLIGYDFTPSNADFDAAFEDGHFKNCEKVLLAQGKAKMNKKGARELYFQLARKNGWDTLDNLKSYRIKSRDGRLMWSIYPTNNDPVTLTGLLAGIRMVLVMSIICGAASLATGYLAAKVALPILSSVFPSMNNKASAAGGILIMLMSQALYGLIMGVSISIASIYGRNRSRFVGLIFGVLMGISGLLLFRELVNEPFMTARYILFTSGVIFSPAITGIVVAQDDANNAITKGIGGGWFFGIPAVVIGVVLADLFNITIQW